MEINKLATEIHRNAKSKGFYEDVEIIDRLLKEKNIDMVENSILFNGILCQRLALIGCEVSEAIESLRRKDLKNFEEEIADILIRTLDLSSFIGIDIEAVTQMKIEANKKREYKHGKVF